MHWKLSMKKNVLTSRACAIYHRFWDINEKLWNCVNRNTHYASFKVKRIIKPPIENESVQLQNKISSNKETYVHFMLFHTILVKVNIKLEKHWFPLQSLQYLVAVVSRLFQSPEELAPVFRPGDWSRPRVEGLLCHPGRSRWCPLHSPPAPSHVHKVCRSSADDNPVKEHRSFTWQQVLPKKFTCSN